MVGDPARDCGLAVRRVEIGPSLTISPGGGKLGSLSWRFIRTVDRRLPG